MASEDAWSSLPSFPVAGSELEGQTGHPTSLAPMMQWGSKDKMKPNGKNPAPVDSADWPALSKAVVASCWSGPLKTLCPGGGGRAFLH